MSIHRLRFCAIALLFLVLTIATRPVLAQQSTDNGIRMTTSPLPVSLVTDPGTTITTNLRIRNSGSKIENFKVSLLKFSASSSDGKPTLKEREPGDDYFDWVSFSPSEFPIAPNEWKTIKMTITVPKSAAFGYYYAVTFSRAGATITPNQSAALVGSTATLVLLEARVPGAKRTVTIDSFTVNRPWYEFLPADFTLNLRNSGNVHVAPYGTVYISNNSQVAGQIDINAAKGNILPQSERAYTAQWSDGFPVVSTSNKDGSPLLDSKGKPTTKLVWDFSQANKLRFGKYTAHLVLAYDNGQGKDVPLEATVEFWVLPWRLVVAAIALPLLPALLVYFLMRWRFKSKKEEW
jgi:hypothetical protein